MRVLFVLVLMFGAWVCMAQTALEHKLGTTLLGTLAGAWVERWLFERRDTSLTERVYFAFLAVLGGMILVLPLAVRSGGLGGVFLLVAGSGLGAEISIALRRRSMRTLHCAACERDMGRWPARDLVSFQSWKCPSCGQLDELHAHEEPAPISGRDGVYRTPTRLERREGVFRPELPLTMGVTLPRWMAIVALSLMSLPILDVLWR
jgi:hypothetical protein